MAAKPRKRLFERLKTGLEEGIAHARGELTLKGAVAVASKKCWRFETFSEKMGTTTLEGHRETDFQRPVSSGNYSKNGENWQYSDANAALRMLEGDHLKPRNR